MNITKCTLISQTMGTNKVFQNVFLSQLSMEFVTKENDETTIGFIHLESNNEDTRIVRKIAQTQE